MPTGWYAVARSAELRPGGVLRCRYFEDEWVLYRTKGGTPRLVGAYCPHLGAHLGHGGVVQGENLRCPFHGFCYDTDGACASTPYGTLPAASTRLTSTPLSERNGLLLAWYDADHREPTWEVPELDMQGWSPLACRRYELPSHPQETTENSVDFGHLTEVHDFRAAEPGELETEGPLLRSRFAIEQPMAWAGLSFVTTKVELDVYVWGLGYSLVEAFIPRFGIRIREFILPIPLDRDSIHLRVASSIRYFKGGALTVPLARMILWGTFQVLCKEVESDIPVWTHKAYVDPPALAKGDGPVGPYRRWARQFYPEFDDG